MVVSPLVICLVVWVITINFCSAAKAPFLARFKVAKCGTKQMEDLNTKEDPGKLICQSLLSHAACLLSVCLLFILFVVCCLFVVCVFVVVF